MLQLLLFYVFLPLQRNNCHLHIPHTHTHTHLAKTCAIFLTRGPGGGLRSQDHARHGYGRVTASFDKPPSRVVPQAGRPSPKGPSKGRVTLQDDCVRVRGPRVCFKDQAEEKKKEETNSQPATNIPRLSLISCLFFFILFFCKAKYIVFIFIAKHSHTTPKKHTHTQHHAKHDKSEKNLLLYYQLNKKTANYQ